MNDASVPLDVAGLSRCTPLALHATWLRARAEGSTELDYDQWLEAHLGERRLPVMQTYRQGSLIFALHHGGEYLVHDPIKGPRRFRCLLDGAFPLISFVGVGGASLPWVTIQGLFSVDELASLQSISG